MAEAPPLPTPQPVQTPDDPLSLYLSTLSNAMPGMDAEVAHAVATTAQSADDALQNGQAAQGYSVSSAQVQAAQDQPPATQKANWNTLSGSQQQMWKSAGYQPPASGGGGLWHSLTHALGQGVHDTLNIAGAPLRAEQHVERTMFAVANQSANDPMSGSWGDVLHSLHSASDWSRAWDQTSSGKSYILPQVKNQVAQQYGAQTYQLALKIAEGTSTTDMMKGLNQQQQDSLMQEMQSDKNLNAAVQKLQAGHVSTGRILADSLGIKPGSGLFNTISGLTDATLDWFGDPVVIGAKTGTAYKAAKYLVRDGSDVRYMAENVSSVKNAMQFVADHVNGQDGAATLKQAFPKLDPLIPDLIKAKPQSVGDVVQFFADNADLGRLTSANPSQLPGGIGGGWMPALSSAGQARVWAKGKALDAIDWAETRPAVVHGLQPGDVVDHPLNGNAVVNKLTTRPIGAVGRFLKKNTTLTPPKEFDTADPHWLNHLSDIASMALPRARVNNVLQEFAESTDLGQKRVLYTNLMKEIYSRLGVADTDPGRKWLTDFAEGAANPTSRAKYSTSDADLMLQDGNLVPEGLDENHLVTKWPVPDYKTIYAQSKKVGILDRMMGVPNSDMVDKFMQKAWKPMTLLREGFALRVAPEEAMHMIIKYGPSAYLKSRIALTALKRGGQIESDSPLIDHAGHLWGMLTDHLPTAVKNKITTPAELAAANLGDATQRAMAKVPGALNGKKYSDAVKLAYDHGVIEDAFADQVSAAHGHGAGYLDGDVLGHQVKVFQNGKLVNATLNPTGAFRDYQNTNKLFSWAWYRQLREMSHSHWDRTVMQTGRDELPYAQRVQKVADEIEKNPKMAARGARWTRTPDGRQVVTGEVTQRQAVEDWAARLIDHVDSATRSPLGDHIEVAPGTSLVDHLLDVGKPPSAALLDTVPTTHMPASVKGPEVLPTLRGGTGFFTKTVNKSFDVLGRQINWMSRQPMFLHNFALSTDALKPATKAWAKMGMGDAEIERNLVKAATQRAVDMTTPYIHNPELRSQFAQVTRNLAPFWFAQEQFYKRWARTMKFSPWAFRQLQLINGGVQHSGFVHKDPTTGQEYFIYPGANVVQDVLTKTLGVFGFKSWLPITAGLRGQVNQASPGLERLGLPSYGPFVTVPLNLVRKVFPELRQPVADVEGPQAASQSFMGSLVPTTVSRIWQDITANPNNSSQYASAMMQAIQYLEASGHGIGEVAIHNLGQVNAPGAPKNIPNSQPGDYVTDSHNDVYVLQGDGTWRQNSPAAMQAYMQRVKNWTRTFLVTRTLFGFNTPASPENQFDPSHINEDLQGLLQTLPLEDALQVFMKEHPDASAYTVFQTATQSGDPLPATADAMSFMDANSSFMNAHPLAGSYFLPQSDTTGKFDLTAYQNQLEEQLRLRKTPAEFWQEVAYNNAANTYFNAEDKKDQMVSAGGGGGMSKTDLENAWTQESQQFMQANPLFAAQLGVTPDTPGSVAIGSTTYTRADLLNDLAAALKDPSAPKTQQTADIRTLVNSYDAYQTMTAAYGPAGTISMSSTERNQIELQYAQQVTTWVAQHPDMQSLYNRLIRPELASVLNTEAANQV